MAETIVPVVHGDRRSRYWRAVGLHTLAATAAAGALGLALGGIGDAAGVSWGTAGALVLAAAAAVYALREAVGIPLPVPDRHRQVPDWWRTFFSTDTTAVLYGLGLGVGFLTFLTYGTLVAVAVAALVSGDPMLSALLVAPFGLARGLSVTVGARTRTAEQAAAVVDRLEKVALLPLPRAVNAVSLAVVAVVALAAAP